MGSEDVQGGRLAQAELALDLDPGRAHGTMVDGPLAGWDHGRLTASRHDGTLARPGRRSSPPPMPRRHTIRRSPMSPLNRIFAPKTVAHAHCDLPCGVYDPEQARIEAESCYRIIEKYAANEDPTFRTRAIAIKEKPGRPRQAPPRRPVARLLQAGAPRDGPEPARAVLDGEQAGLQGQGLDQHRRREEAARPHRRGRRGLEGHRRGEQDPRRRPPRLIPVRPPMRGSRPRP